MKVKDLTLELKKFQLELLEHRSLYARSLKRKTSRYPSINVEELEKQSRSLSRNLGRLRPYLEHLRTGWRMLHRATGTHWDSLNSSTGLRDISWMKTQSLDDVIQALDQIIGKLESMGPEEEIPVSEIRTDPSDISDKKGGETTSGLRIDEPEKVTLEWLFRNVPAKLWISFFGFCILLIMAGISLGQLSFVQEMLRHTQNQALQTSDVEKERVSRQTIRNRKAKAALFFADWKRFKGLLIDYQRRKLTSDPSSWQGEYSKLREKLQKDFFYFRPFLVEFEEFKKRSQLGINNLGECFSVAEIEHWESRIKRILPREVDCFDSYFIELIESFSRQLDNIGS